MTDAAGKTGTCRSGKSAGPFRQVVTAILLMLFCKGLHAELPALLQAKDQFNSGQWQSAEKGFLAVLAVDPGNADVHAFLGMTMFFADTGRNIRFTNQPGKTRR